MARIGLGSEWRCVFANDIDRKKAEIYRAYFGDNGELVVGDIAAVTPEQLPGHVDLAWASFPCQDLSLAGNGTGLNGKRSGTFWPFWNLMRALVKEGRAPRTIVLENVYGAVTSHKGRDLAAICGALASEGYRFAPMVIDAKLFLPQSRPRLFITAFAPGVSPPGRFLASGPNALWHPDSFAMAYDRLTEAEREMWLWLDLPVPPPCNVRLEDLLEEEPCEVEWHSPAETARLLDMMSPINRAKVEQAMRAGRRMVGTVYKRTRADRDKSKRQRAEVRFDGVAGCLRTPGGGSSRQIILVVEGSRVRSRLISPREAARLMGLPEDYPLPPGYNDAYRLVGDGVVVPVVSWLARHLIDPAVGVEAKAA